MKSPISTLRCPKCGEPVYRAGNVHEGGSKSGTVRYGHKMPHRKTCGWHGTKPIGIEVEESRGVDRAGSEALFKSIKGRRKARYVITSAQNATPINKAFLASLLTYCRVNDAQLIVIPYRYKNPTSIWSAKAEHDDWWAPEITKYLLDIRVALNPNLVLLADIKTQPTASSPLTGFETMTGSQSAIVGHPKIELVTVPTPQSRMAKIMTTTGAVTEKNYIPSKAGKKGEHHHTFGAAVVEVDGKRFHLRQLNAVRDGSFCDLDREYAGEKVTKCRVEALVMGDTHEEFVDPDVVKATFVGPKSIVATLKPKYLVWHDLHDFYSRNHHHRGEVFINYVKHHSGRDNVRKALEQTFAFVDRVTPKDAINIFVPSNHPDALARWVKETDPRTDPENCVFWAETFRVMCEGSKWTDTGARTIDPFVYWAKRMLKTVGQGKFPSRSDSVMICGIDVNHHGDAGPNGAKGNLLGFTKIGVKTVTAHGHSPGIKDGAYRVGLNARKNMEYVRGPSSWMHTDCLIYGNGKRSLLFIIDGRHRA